MPKLLRPAGVYCEFRTVRFFLNLKDDESFVYSQTGIVKFPLFGFIFKNLITSSYTGSGVLEKIRGHVAIIFLLNDKLKP